MIIAAIFPMTRLVFHIGMSIREQSIELIFVTLHKFCFTLGESKAFLILVITIHFRENDSEQGEEDLDDNNADANVNDIHPHADRWRPAGTAVCQILCSITFALFCMRWRVPVLLKDIPSI